MGEPPHRPELRRAAAETQAVGQGVACSRCERGWENGRQVPDRVGGGPLRATLARGIDKVTAAKQLQEGFPQGALGRDRSRAPALRVMGKQARARQACRGAVGWAGDRRPGAGRTPLRGKQQPPGLCARSCPGSPFSKPPGRSTRSSIHDSHSHHQVPSPWGPGAGPCTRRMLQQPPRS